MNNPITDQNDITNETAVLSAKSACCGIYGLRNKITGKWYVGQSRDIWQRWRKYRRLDCKNQWKLLYALKKYGVGSFDEVLIEECDEVDWIMDYREMYWMRKYDCLHNGYNIREGGSHGKMSAESRLRMSVSGKGKKKPKRTSEQLENMAAAQRGKRASDETRKKMRLQRKGKKMPTRSIEHRRKISESAKLRYKDKSRHPNYGKIYSPERIEKMRQITLKQHQAKTLKLSDISPSFKVDSISTFI
jgi:group I intron endonuclease